MSEQDLSQLIPDLIQAKNNAERERDKVINELAAMKKIVSDSQTRNLELEEENEKLIEYLDTCSKEIERIEKEIYELERRNRILLDAAAKRRKRRNSSKNNYKESEKPRVAPIKREPTLEENFYVEEKLSVRPQPKQHSRERVVKVNNNSNKRIEIKKSALRGKLISGALILGVMGFLYKGVEPIVVGRNMIVEDFEGKFDEGFIKADGSSYAKLDKTPTDERELAALAFKYHQYPDKNFGYFDAIEEAIDEYQDANNRGGRR